MCNCENCDCSEKKKEYMNNIDSIIRAVSAYSYHLNKDYIPELATLHALMENAEEISEIVFKE